MACKRINILFISDGKNRVKQFRAPQFVLVLFAFFSLLISASLFMIIQDYVKMKSDMPELTRLQKENAQQKRQFVHLARRIDQINQKMCDLKEFDRKLKVMVNLETSDENGQLGVGGSDPIVMDAKNAMGKAHREVVRSMHRSLDNLQSEIELGEQDKAELHKFIKSQKVLLASTPSIWPTKGWLSSRFGYRVSPFTGQKEFHKGIDISARMKAPIIAPAGGIISFVGRDRGYGNVVTINHGHGIMTKYAHLNKSLVKKGQYVKRGETIALVGNTGRSTGPHLHYEVHLNKVSVNPLRYILN